MRAILRKLLFEQQRVGADGPTYLPRDGACADDFRKLAMQQRFAARDDDDRRAAVVDRRDAVGDRQTLVEDLVGIVDLAAARAGEIA